MKSGLSNIGKYIELILFVVCFSLMIVIFPVSKFLAWTWAQEWYYRCPLAFGLGLSFAACNIVFFALAITALGKIKK